PMVAFPPRTRPYATGSARMAKRSAPGARRSTATGRRTRASSKPPSSMPWPKGQKGVSTHSNTNLACAGMSNMVVPLGRSLHERNLYAAVVLTTLQQIGLVECDQHDEDAF